MQALPCIELTEDEKNQLRRLVCEVLQYGTTNQERYVPDWPINRSLQKQAATFVTLYYQAQLHGCIGSIVVRLPLWQDVVERSHASAFADRRFSPLRAAQLKDITFSISILSEIKLLKVKDETDLLKQIQPGHPGLMLREGAQCALYLPSVWENLDNPKSFVNSLKIKGGWPADYWSQDMEISYFHVSRIDGSFVNPSPSTD